MKRILTSLCLALTWGVASAECLSDRDYGASKASIFKRYNITRCSKPGKDCIYEGQHKGITVFCKPHFDDQDKLNGYSLYSFDGDDKAKILAELHQRYHPLYLSISGKVLNLVESHQAKNLMKQYQAMLIKGIKGRQFVGLYIHKRDYMLGMKSLKKSGTPATVEGLGDLQSPGTDILTITLRGSRLAVRFNRKN